MDRQSNYPFSANVKSLYRRSQGINCRETLQQFWHFSFFLGEAVITTGNLPSPLSLRTLSFLSAEWCLWLSKKLFSPFFSNVQDVVMQQQSLKSHGNRSLLLGLAIPLALTYLPGNQPALLLTSTQPELCVFNQVKTLKLASFWSICHKRTAERASHFSLSLLMLLDTCVKHQVGPWTRTCCSLRNARFLYSALWSAF